MVYDVQTELDSNPKYEPSDDRLEWGKTVSPREAVLSFTLRVPSDRPHDHLNST